MEKKIEYGSCDFCGRTDVPICSSCHQLVPHGMIPGTWLPCHCGGMGQTTVDNILANALEEYNSNHRKEVEK